MGAILKGRDVDLGRELAVKVLLEAHQGSPDVVRRFVEEAQIGGQLQHPGVVPVYELGTFADRRPYFAMKLVRGRTLAALLAERGASLGPPPPLPRPSPAKGGGSQCLLPPRGGGQRRGGRGQPPTLPVHLRASLPDHGLRPRPRRDPPRPEARERDGGQLRRSPGDGLGSGQGLAAGRSRRRGHAEPRPTQP